MMRGWVGHLGDWRRQGTGGRETRDRWGTRGDKRQVGAGDNRQEEDDYTGFKWSYQLWSIAAKSVGLSGRTLRKLPFLAIALFADPLGKQSLEYYVDRSYLTNRYHRYLTIVL